MKILVTGGAGFIGSHIVDRYIERGHDVHVIDNMSTGRASNKNKKAVYHEIDICDSAEVNKIFEREMFDVVNHHAAQINVRSSVEEPIIDAQTNIIGSLSIFEACRKNGVKKIIFASSGGAVYGEQAEFPANEETIVNPVSPYGITKLTTEYYLNFYKEIYGINCVIFRYTNVYGPRQNHLGEAGVISIFINKIESSEDVIIYGDGTNTRDYVHVNDVAHANELALQEGVSGVFNICTNIETSVNELFEMFNVVNSNSKAIHVEKKAGEISRSIASFNKFNKKTGWEPSIYLNDGIFSTLNYFKKNK